MAHLIPDFDPDGMRPFFLHRWTRRNAGTWLATVAVVLAVAVLASALTSGLSPVLIRDAAIGEVQRLFGISFGASPRAQGIGWPIWRDLVSIVILLAMAWTPFNAAQQVDGYRRLLSSMQKFGAIAVRTAGDQQVVSSIVARANSRIAAWQRATVPILIAYFGLCVFLFQRLAEWYEPGVGSWWALGHPLISSVYVFVCAFGLYTATMQNICGAIVSVAVVRIRDHVEVGVDLANVDGKWGWSAAGAVLGATYRDITVHLFALIALVLASPNADGWWWVSIVALLLSMATAPLWIVFPFVFTRRLVARFKATELSSLRDGKRGGAAYSLTMASRADRLNSVPSVPFLRFWSVAAAIVAQLVNVWALLGVIESVGRVMSGVAPGN